MSVRTKLSRIRQLARWSYRTVRQNLAGGSPSVDTSGAAVHLGYDETQHPAHEARIVARHNEPDWIVSLANWVPPKPKSALAKKLAYVWASPITAAGLLTGLSTLRSPKQRDGVLVFENSGGPAGLFLKKGRYAAFTLGHVVVAKGEPSDELIAHELVHTRQAEHFGVFLAPVYWGLLIMYGYTRHPMERAARVAGREAKYKKMGRPIPKTFAEKEKR